MLGGRGDDTIYAGSQYHPAMGGHEAVGALGNDTIIGGLGNDVVNLGIVDPKEYQAVVKLADGTELVPQHDPHTGVTTYDVPEGETALVFVHSASIPGHIVRTLTLYDVEKVVLRTNYGWDPMAIFPGYV